MIEGADAVLASRSRACRLWGSGQISEPSSLRTGGGERELDAACGLDDARADLQQLFAQGRELGDGERMGLGDGVAQHHPIGGGVQNEPHLIGERRAAGGSIRRQLALVQFFG